MRVFLTGATGYIGSALARRLRAGGHEVAALVRATSAAGRRELLRSAGVELFEGDVVDRYSLREGMSGADWVVHAAADLDFGGPHERQRAINIEGSDNVASLAFKLGVGRLLAISTITVFGGSPSDGAAATEESPALEPLPSHYGFTKRQADRVIAEWVERGLAVNTVYPSLVYGPPGRKGGANPLLRMLALGRLPALVAPRRLASWVFLDDVVDGILRVIDRGPVGENYLLTGDIASMEGVARRVAELAGSDVPRWQLSPAVAGLAGAVTRPLYRMRGRRSPFLKDYLRSLARHWAFDDAKARRELGWRPRSLDEGLPETVRHLLDRGAETGSGTDNIGESKSPPPPNQATPG